MDHLYLTGKLKVHTVFNTFHSHLQERELKSLNIVYTDGRNAVLVHHMPQCFYFVCRAKNHATLFYNDHYGSIMILLTCNLFLSFCGDAVDNLYPPVIQCCIIGWWRSSECFDPWRWDHNTILKYHSLSPSDMAPHPRSMEMSASSYSYFGIRIAFVVEEKVLCLNQMSDTSTCYCNYVFWALQGSSSLDSCRWVW